MTARAGTLPAKAGTVIVGAGIQGLLLAFNLADAGKKDIVVLDAGYWQGGASGRNGTLVRGGFSSQEWTRFFSHSVEEWRRLSRRLGHNVMYTRRGYAIIAESEATGAIIDTAAETHRQIGIRSELLGADRLRRVLPAADQGRIRAALFLPDGGIAPHHAAMRGALEACRARGVQVFYQTPVTGFERTGNRIDAVLCGDRRMAADLTVICAGAHSTDLAELAGVELDAEAFRIEAMATEPLRPVIGPALALIDRLTYLHQTARGEIVGGSEMPGETAKRGLESTDYVMPTYARHVIEMFPALAGVRILRQWSGMIHMTPDGGPLLGLHPDMSNLWISAGWTYGIAGAPGAADLLAKAIVSGRTDDRMTPFAVDRFRRGEPVEELSTVIDTTR
jgi:sarcosine oxidase subunit beta